MDDAAAPTPSAAGCSIYISFPIPGSHRWLPFTRNNVSEIPVQQVENRVTSPFLIHGELRFPP